MIAFCDYQQDRHQYDNTYDNMHSPKNPDVNSIDKLAEISHYVF